MITLERQSLISKHLSSAETQAEVVTALSRIAYHFGFTYFTLANAPVSTDNLLEPLIVETTLPIDYIRTFDENRFLPICPLVPLMKNMVLPLCWMCRPPDVEGGPPQFPAALCNLLLDHNMSTGVAMPLQSSDGSSYFIRLDGARPLLTLPELNEVGMLLLQAFTVYDRLRREAPATAKLLSIRELEVLRWTSQGKTSSEIARILSLSDHTVNAYLNKAIKKLDCVNRTQLVAKAIRLRLIN
ncbi:LuxR C-terminal-related transcriptional regulator [Rhizobium sp. SGZ-381]|uniref:helix-turn-helix transcriptional regulator n=1 Tax=Rhizobium sp. SGZ-381 TaxID=3342800 RepID=UPI00366BD0D1